MGAATLIMGGILVGLQLWFPSGPSLLFNVVRLGGMIGVGMLVYFVCLRLFHVEEVRALKSQFFPSRRM
jgi:hypothetical protein